MLIYKIDKGSIPSENFTTTHNYYVIDEKTIEGLKLTLRQFTETLESEGVTAIDPQGEVFDPNTQEAVMQVPPMEGDVPGTVKQVFLKGYKLGDKVIRYAQVVVIGEN